MDTTNEPVDAVKTWQEWYRNHQVVAQMDEPLVTKDSRENLHDTTKVVSCHEAVCAASKAEEYFADTIAEFASVLSGKELYKAFYAAAQQNLDNATKEYNKAKQLVDALKGLN